MSLVSFLRPPPFDVLGPEGSARLTQLSADRADWIDTAVTTDTGRGARTDHFVVAWLRIRWMRSTSLVNDFRTDGKPDQRLALRD